MEVAGYVGLKAVVKISNNFKSVPVGIKVMSAANGEAARKIEKSILDLIIADYYTCKNAKKLL